MFESGTQSNTGAPHALDPERLRTTAPFRVLAGRNLSKADVRFYQLGALGGVVLKDYRERPFLVRHTLGRFFTAREAAAYRAAAGVDGLPEFLGRVGPFALALRLVEGTPLCSLPREALGAEVFARLAAIVDALHARGIALADLHHRDVLVGPGGSVHVVDLATAWIAGPDAGALRRAIFARLKTLDSIALSRLLARGSETSEAEAVRAAGGRLGAALYRSGRRLKRLWNLLRGRRSRALSSGRGKSA